MKKNLFTTMYAYTQTESDSPKEDYSTEALVYLLEFSLNKGTLFFLEFMRLLNIKIHVSDYEIYSIHTQRHFYTNRNMRAVPDICIETPDEYFFIEVKVESSLNLYSIEDEDGSNDYLNQIQKYQEIKVSKKKSIYLLTKYFCHELFKDCKDFRKKLRWHDIYMLLQKYKAQDPVEKYLLSEFAQYMKEKKMKIPKVSYELVNGMESLKALMEQIKTALEANKIPYRVSTSSSWIGFLLLTEKKQTSFKGWVGTVLDGSKVEFGFSGTNIRKVIEKKYPSLYEKYSDGYRKSFDFEDHHFFCLKPEEQFQKLKEWIDENHKKLVQYSKEELD